VADIARKCIPGPIGRPIAEALCRRMVNEDVNWFQDSEETHLLAVIIKYHRTTALNALIGNNSPVALYRAKLMLGGHDSDDGVRGSPIDILPLEVLKKWVNADRAARAPLAAQVVLYFEPDGEAFRWTPVVLWLLGLSEQGIEVRRELEHRFHVGSWSGSSSSRYVRRLPLAEALFDHPDPAVRDWAKSLHENLKSWIAKADEEDRSEAQRFE
jgi:hypothetical protein